MPILEMPRQQSTAYGTTKGKSNHIWQKLRTKVSSASTGSYSCGTKKVNVNVLHPKIICSRKASPLDKGAFTDEGGGKLYLEVPDELLQIGSNKTGQSSLQTASRGFSKQSSQSSGSTSERVSQIVLEKDFSIRSEHPRAVTAVIKGHTSGDEQWLRQERCSRLGSHRSWQCN
jgi:hypothetical protein